MLKNSTSIFENILTNIFYEYFWLFKDLQTHYFLCLKLEYIMDW